MTLNQSIAIRELEMANTALTSLIQNLTNQILTLTNNNNTQTANCCRNGDQGRG